MLPAWREITTAFELDWVNRQYKHPNQLAPLTKREDEDLLLILTATRPINEQVDLSAQYIFQTNDSNIAAFEYRRNMIGLIVTAKY